MGPVVITDTAGIDDTTELGTLRMEKTEEVVKRLTSLFMYFVPMKSQLLMICIGWGFKTK